MKDVTIGSCARSKKHWIFQFLRDGRSGEIWAASAYRGGCNPEHEREREPAPQMSKVPGCAHFIVLNGGVPEIPPRNHRCIGLNEDCCAADTHHDPHVAWRCSAHCPLRHHRAASEQ